MSVDPKILARMREARDPQDDGSEGAVYDDEPTLGIQIPVSKFQGLPTLVGTPKQVKWAVTIRDNALDLTWPAETEAKLKSIVDSTWWIANKSIVHTMKFKEPSPHQIVGGSAPPKGRAPGNSPSPATPSSAYLDAMTPLSGAPPVERRTPHEKRVDDALAWAESVSRHPTLAQAAILSCLRFAYPKGAMRDRITAKGRELLAQANMEVNRDTDAIQLMLSKE